MAGHTNGTGNGHDIASAEALLAKRGIMPADSAMAALQDEGGVTVRRVRGNVLKEPNGPRQRWKAMRHAISGLLAGSDGRPMNLEADVGRVRSFKANIEALRDYYANPDQAPHQRQKGAEKLEELGKLEAAFSVAAASALTRHVIALFVKPAAENAAMGFFGPAEALPKQEQLHLREIWDAIRPSDMTESFKQRLGGLAAAIPVPKSLK